jgi:hypothetical protein
VPEHRTGFGNTISNNIAGLDTQSTYGPPMIHWMPYKFTLLIRYSSHQLLLYLNYRVPGHGGAESAAEVEGEETAANLALLGQFQNLHLAQSTTSSHTTNPFAHSRSSASSASNPFRGQANSLQSRPAHRLQRAPSPAPSRSAFHSATYQPAYAPANAGPYATPTGSVGYPARYGQTEQSGGALLHPHTIQRPATAQPSLSRQAAVRS